MTDEFCPDCGAPLDFDEVDIDVGVQRGNYGCPECGWVPKSLDEIDEPSDCQHHYSDLGFCIDCGKKL